MNTLSTTRFGANLLVGGAAIAVLCAGLIGAAVSPIWILSIGALAVVGAIAQIAASILRPAAIRPAWDEQAVASHRGSYQFGYWVALVAFWVFFVLTQWGGLDPQTAFLWMGPILIAAPSAWMIIATFAGRVG